MDSGTLEITQSLTFEHVRELSSALSERISSNRSVVVDLAGCSGIDLAGVQLLISAVKSAEASGVTLTIVNPDRYRKICEFSGLTPVGCGGPDGTDA